MRSTIVDGLADLNAVRSAWDDLAVAAGRPTASPAWMLGWWRHAQRGERALRVVVVHDDTDKLLAVAPFWVETTKRGIADYRLLAAEISPEVTIPAVSHRPWGDAEPIAQALASASPTPDVVTLAPLRVSDQWPAAMREVWPGKARPLALKSAPVAARTVVLRQPGFDAWLTRRDAGAHERAVRLRDELASAGGGLRLCNSASVEQDITTFTRLVAHPHASAGPRLGSLGARVPEFLLDIASELGAGERFRLRMIEMAGEPLGALLSISAGYGVATLGIGWDERLERFNPAYLLLLEEIEDGFARGEQRIGLGLGLPELEAKVSDGDDPIVETALLAGGARLPLALGAVAPAVARAAWARLRDDVARTADGSPQPFTAHPPSTSEAGVR